MKDNSDAFAQISDILSHAIQRHIPYAYKLPSFVLKKLKLTSCCDVIPCDHDHLWSSCFEAISPYVEIIDAGQADTVVAVIGSGVWGMNPAFVALKCADKKIYIVAMAKEGLINQNTAQKAVDMIKNIIETP